MLGITYDTHDDLLDVALDRQSHLIRQIVVQELFSGLASVAVTTADGTQLVVRPKEPLLLPAATERQ